MRQLIFPCLLLLFTVACSEHVQDLNVDDGYPGDRQIVNFIPIWDTHPESGGSRWISLNFTLTDMSTAYILLNYSNPYHIGTGVNSMVAGGVLTGAYTPSTLNCLLDEQNLGLVEISVDEAYAINDSTKWIWYNGTFYSFHERLFEQNYSGTPCFIEQYAGTYNSTVVEVPSKVSVALDGSFPIVDLGSYEVYPEITFKQVRNGEAEGTITSVGEVHFFYRSKDGIQHGVSKDTNGTLIMKPSLLLTQQKRSLYPFDFFEAEIYNITPSTIATSQIDVDFGRESSYVGLAYFNDDKIIFKIERSTRSKTLILLTSLVVIATIISGIHLVMKTSKKNLRKSLHNQLIPLIAAVGSLIISMLVLEWSPILFIILVLIGFFVCMFSKKYWYDKA